VQREVLYGYSIEFEILGVDIFQFIQENKDDLLWERGFRPAFTEEKYVKCDEKRRIILTPPCTFTVEIAPQSKDAADKQLEDTRLLIEALRNIINLNAEVTQRKLKYVLVCDHSLDIGTLLPKWYISAVDLQHTKLTEFKTSVEDVKEDKVRQTEVALKTKEGNVLEIKVISQDLSLAKNLMESIMGQTGKG